MQVLISFPRKKVDLFFEGALLEAQIKKACKNAGFSIAEKFSRDVDIANFINLSSTSITAIRQAVFQSIPTILWMFYANNDNYARIIEVRNDGKLYIPTRRLETINMMDAVVVPTSEAKLILRKLKVKIPIFVIPGAVDVNRIEELRKNGGSIFRRYFRINNDQKYAISVMNVKARKELEELVNLASAVPDYNFYALVSSSTKLLDRVILKTYDKTTPKNLIITKLIPEDVYRSGLLEASYFIDLGVEKMNVMTLYEPLYLKVPLIMNKNVIFSEIIDKTKAIVVNDFNGATYAIRNKIDTTSFVTKAEGYTKNVTAKTFTEAIAMLFKKIYTR